MVKRWKRHPTGRGREGGGETLTEDYLGEESRELVCTTPSQRGDLLLKGSVFMLLQILSTAQRGCSSISN